jgi:hypothetical protein
MKNRKKYSKTNGYYKYYNSEGLKCRIKVTKNAKCRKNDAFTIAFLRPFDYNWNYDIPVDKKNKKMKIFKDCFDVINFILKNLETDGTIFKIL